MPTTGLWWWWTSSDSTTATSPWRSSQTSSRGRKNSDGENLPSRGPARAESSATVHSGPGEWMTMNSWVRPEIVVTSLASMISARTAKARANFSDRKLSRFGPGSTHRSCRFWNERFWKEKETFNQEDEQKWHRPIRLLHTQHGVSFFEGNYFSLLLLHGYFHLCNAITLSLVKKVCTKNITIWLKQIVNERQVDYQVENQLISNNMSTIAFYSKSSYRSLVFI
jgi:hypothetical protein